MINVNISSAEIPLSPEQTRIKFINDPVFVFVGRIGNIAKHHVPVHKHDTYTEIIFISQGEGKFLIDDKEYLAKEGDVIIFNRGQYHEEYYFSDTCMESFYCGISNVNIEGFDETWILPRGAEAVLDSGSQKERIKYLMQVLYQEGCTRDTGYNYICNNILMNLIILLIRILNQRYNVLRSSGEGTKIQLANTAKCYIDANYARKMTVAEIADYLHVSTFYLSHVFKETMGISLIRYCNRRKIDEAKKLLLSTPMSINEIAHSIGFENANHFYLPFRKATGLTPQEFRDSGKRNIVTFIDTADHEDCIAQVE